MLKRRVSGEMNPNREGRWAELRALRLLKGCGWDLVVHGWSCRYGEIDLLVAKGQRLMMVEVKARRSLGRDAWGLNAFDRGKRLRLKRTFACWQGLNPERTMQSFEVVLALVPLPPSRRLVRWVRIDEMGADD
ncbi:MAG: YraN family protein [Prochlorococcus sp.]